jgi:colanic acid/amylovoran biosynthesis glycosyltransferase
MKIAYLTTCFGTPSHTFIRREIRELREQGCDVSLLGIRQDTKSAPDSNDLVKETTYLYPVKFFKTILLNIYYSIVRCHLYWPNFFDIFFSSNDKFKQKLKLCYHLFISVRFAQIAQKAGYTHIHAHFLHVPSSIAMFSAKLSCIPFSITIHSAGEKDLPHVDGIALKIRSASVLLMISQFNIEYYDKLEPCKHKSQVVRCGMNIEDFSFRANRNQNGKTLKVLAVGRFVEKKGFIYLAKAAKLIKCQNKDCKIEILGSGPLHEVIEEYILQNKLEDIISLPGQASTQEVKEKMLGADIVVVPSVTSVSGEMEGIPVVLMEAMASGTPVVATEHSGIPELVKNNITGSLVPEKDEVRLAQAILSFIPNEAVRVNARKVIEDEFDISNVVSLRLQIFK